MDIFGGTLFCLDQNTNQFFRIHTEKNLTTFSVAKYFRSAILESGNILSYILTYGVSSKLFTT